MAECENAKSIAQETPVFPASANVRQLTEAVITALTEWNTVALEQLLKQASGWIENPPAPHLLAASADQHRLLGALLQETERNLRMFRETSPCMKFQAGTGTYESRWS